MKYCASILAAVGLFTGCTHNGTGSSARYSSGAVGITPLDSPRESRVRAEAGISENSEERRNADVTAAAGEFQEIPLYREELRVGKRQVPKGEVIVRKVVQITTTNIPVQLRREDIVVERIQPGEGTRNFSGAAQPFQEREIVMELNREVPTVEKSAAIAEVVRARKTTDTQTQNIVGTVRSEHMDVDREMAQAFNAERDESAAGGPAANVSESASSEARPERLEQDQAQLVLHREQLNVGKREVPSGRVVLRKTIDTQRVSEPVELRSEDVEIERGPADEGSQSAQAFQSREIVIPLYEEVPVTEKEVRLAEVIRARKTIETEQENINSQLRHEQLEVVRNDAGNRNQNEAQGGPASIETGRSEPVAPDTRISWEGRDRFSGQITVMDLDNRRVTVRNQEGQTRTFTFSDKPVLTIKENRSPSLWNFKPGYPVTIGHRGDVAEIMIRSDAPEVR